VSELVGARLLNQDAKLAHKWIVVGRLHRCPSHERRASSGTSR
jgi:hypothetical protein